VGLSLRLFIASDADLAAVSQAKWMRIHRGQERLPQYAGREVRLLEAVVEVDHRVVLRPVAVLAYRVFVDRHGIIDRHAQHARFIDALHDYTKLRTMESEIAKLQRDASYFWVPTEEHWSMLGRALGLPVADLMRVLRQGSG
jgi:hypothetical protein